VLRATLANPDLVQSNLFQIPVPESCVGRTFEHLFFTLLDDKLIALGIYRLKGATDNEYPYVYTNPSYKTVVTHRDRVFVLGVEIPDYLEGADDYKPLDTAAVSSSSRTPPDQAVML
jgi:hypothetical protein